MVAVCGSMMEDLTLLTSTVSTTQPLSISASRAVLVSIRCFCIYRVRANDRLLSLRLGPLVLLLNIPHLYTEQRCFQEEIWEGLTQEREEFYRSISIFTKTEPNQTFSYKKRKHTFALCFMSSFG